MWYMAATIHMPAFPPCLIELWRDEHTSLLTSYKKLSQWSEINAICLLFFHVQVVVVVVDSVGTLIMATTKAEVRKMRSSGAVF